MKQHVQHAYYNPEQMLKMVPNQ